MRGTASGTGRLIGKPMPSTRRRQPEDLQFHPVTPKRLPDLKRFSAEHGKFGYCSCMRWRLRSSDYRESSKAGRADALYARVRGGEATGVLAYDNDLPIGWCSLGPRESYAALERYRALPRIDDSAIWSVVCFFVDSRYRRHGLTVGLLEAAVTFAASAGAHIVEGYPVEPDAKSYTYMGSPNTFRQAGFRDMTPAGQARTIMRYHIETSGRAE